MTRKTKRPSAPAHLPPHDADALSDADDVRIADADGPELEPDAEDDDAPLPDLDAESISAAPAGPLAQGREAIVQAVRHAPAGAGVYRMLNAQGEVLYVGKAKSLRKRLASYARANGLVLRIQRMVAATVQVEIISTASETEALLLEANLIKQLRPRYNVLLRDDKSFPYILITGDHWAPQIIKHRGAQTRQGRYFGPFASGTAVNRTITVLQRAFLIRTCTDAFFESRTRPCLLYQIKRCAGPCTQEVDYGAYGKLVDEATAFLSGRSRAVKERLAGEMEKASADLDFETAAIYRDRLSALAMVQAQQGINPRSVEEADVFAIHQEGGYFCIEVFFFRIGQNWGNRAYYPRADQAMAPGDVLGPFLAQFYAGKPVPRLILLSENIDERGLLEEALSAKVGFKVEIVTPQRGEKRDLVNHALVNAREALARKLAEAASQARLLEAMAETLALPRVPRRIEVYDNSHIQGTNAVGAMIVAGREGFAKNQYRKFNMRSDKLNPGDDYAMMREMLERRFRAYEADASPSAPASSPAPEESEAGPLSTDMPPWPDLVMIDGGRGQLAVAEEVLAKVGARDVAVMAIAKGEERNAGRETLFMPGKAAIKLAPRDPVLYLIQRLRDEAHRFVIGSHRTRRSKSLREGGLQDIPGVGPTRKRALLLHFGTLKAIELASLADLTQVPGISGDIARRIFDFFHPETA